MRLTPEQDELRSAIRKFCDQYCGDRQQRMKLTDGGINPHNQEIYRMMADLGWVGIGIPEEYGGSGGTLVDKMILFEEANRGMAPVSALGPSHIVAGIYERYGTPAQKASALAAIAAGEVFAISISEPEAGSDVANVSCAARRDGDVYVLNGQKTWCSAAHHSGRILLLARTSRTARRHDGLTLFEVPSDSAGLQIRPIGTLAGREVNDLYLTDVTVPADHVLGDVDRAWKHVMAGLNGERLLCAAQSLGIAQRALDDVLEYISVRRQFGRTIGSFQAIRHRIADLATEVECSRLLTYEVAALVADGAGDAGELVRLTSMAKLKVSETAKSVALEGMQMMGGYGYSTEFDMERHVRSALILPIFAGANEVQRDIIARTYNLRDPETAG